MWALKGGCTGPEAMTIMKEKHDMRSAAETEKAVRATARQAKKDKVDEQLRRAALPLIALIEGGHMTDIDRLEKTKLISLLIFYNATVVGMRQKPKAELAALVKQIPRLQVLLSTATSRGLPQPSAAPPAPPAAPADT